MKDTILFIDNACPRPYDPTTVDLPGLGGTEQGMVVLAGGLASRFNVVVEQHNREDTYVCPKDVTYSPAGGCKTARWVVCLRIPSSLLNARERFRDAKLYLQAHDMPSRPLGDEYARGVFKATKTNSIICVSSWHATQTIELIKAFGYSAKDPLRIRFLHNPLHEDVVLTRGLYDCNKLVWLASPHKGLARAYELMVPLVKLNKEFKLYVSNPGYYPDINPSPEIADNVVQMGTVSHSEAISHLRQGLCLFYPNTVFPETFGKIMAEANAVGTPVITHPIGAAREVLDSHPGQLVDCRNTEAVVKRVMSWYAGERPTVRGNPAFKLARVVDAWEKLLRE